MSKYLESNTILKDKYQIKNVMGENPLGITYDGMDMATGRRGVVREFFPSKLCERVENSILVTPKEGFEERKKQFIRESMILKENIGMESIVNVFDVFEQNGTAYTIMEYVEGVSLEKYLSGSGKQFPVKRIKELMAPVMDSLSILHGKGLIHQNISPDNLIFTNKGNLKLIGFGCIEGQISDAGVGYTPIELYRKQQEINPGTDVYSLCATIYRCITGTVPQDAYTRLNHDTLQKPSQLGITIATAEEAALMMGLNVYGEKRFRAMTAFRKAFYGENAQTAQPQPIQKPDPAVQPQVYMQPQMPVQPQPYTGPVGGMVPPETGKKGKKKEKPQKKEKSGNGGMIALIVVGSILIIALGVSAFILGRNLFMGEGIMKVKTDSEESTEESTEISTEEENNDTFTAYETMLTNGDYIGAIDAITALDLAKVTAEEKDTLSKLLEQAITGQYADFESRVSASQNSGDYEGAFAAIEEELALYDRLSINSLSMQYVDRQKVVDKKANVKNAHISFLTNEKLNTTVSQGDEAALNEIMSKLQEYVNDGTLTQEDFEGKKTKAYARFVTEKISAMNNAGTDAATILDYINQNLSKTGNNCQVLEFWDYFNAVLGGNRMDARVRHVSSNGYLLEYSNSVNLTDSDISHLSQYELRLAVYEIFARHGRTFSDQAVNNYFSQYSWYQPTSANFDES
ncbi:MAG: YARHG domain-containing protein, partial [Lachnospiraceae bacterium]|nr:YARHG domain-containing protein [Lachnospiraceae bacterium]